jgi:uncharacterized protein
MTRNVLIAVLAATSLRAQDVDPRLLTYINGIKAIDSHAHPMRPVARGAPADTEYDALPLDGIPTFALPWRLTTASPVWRTAQAAMYAVKPATSDSVYKKNLIAAIKRVQLAQGVKFPTWALDQAGIDVMMSNRIVMGPGLEAPRFRWVAFDDALMLPLDTRLEATRTPDKKALYPLEAKLLRRYLRDLGVASMPQSLDGYVRTVVAPTLARQRKNGAVAIKFEAAYLRALDFDDPDPNAAQRIYAQFVSSYPFLSGAGSPTPTRAEYKTLEDDLFRVICKEAGRLDMAVQIHTLEQFGGYYSATGSTPLLLEHAFNDPELRGTKFVVVHGGWPLVAQTQTLLAKPNVYTDMSMMDVMLGPAELANAIRPWLGEWPDKVLFGTDAFDGGPDQGWDQVAWVAQATARRALAMALTTMMRTGEITRDRANVLARMVLRENAMKVYDLRTH